MYEEIRRFEAIVVDVEHRGREVRVVIDLKLYRAAEDPERFVRSEIAGHLVELDRA